MNKDKTCWLPRPSSDALSEASCASAQSWCGAPPGRYVDPPAPPVPAAADSAPWAAPARGPEGSLAAQLTWAARQLPKYAVAGAVMVAAGAGLLKVRLLCRLCLSAVLAVAYMRVALMRLLRTEAMHSCAAACEAVLC